MKDWWLWTSACAVAFPICYRFLRTNSNYGHPITTQQLSPSDGRMMNLYMLQQKRLFPFDQEDGRILNVQRPMDGTAISCFFRIHHGRDSGAVLIFFLPEVILLFLINGENIDMQVLVL